MPISLETVLLFAYSIIIKINPQTTRVERMAAKLKSETFKNLPLTGTKKKMIIMSAGTKNG